MINFLSTPVLKCFPDCHYVADRKVLHGFNQCCLSHSGRQKRHSRGQLVFPFSVFWRTCLIVFVILPFFTIRCYIFSFVDSASLKLIFGLKPSEGWNEKEKILMPFLFSFFFQQNGMGLLGLNKIIGGVILTSKQGIMENCGTSSAEKCRSGSQRSGITAFCFLLNMTLWQNLLVTISSNLAGWYRKESPSVRHSNSLKSSGQTSFICQTPLPSPIYRCGNAWWRWAGCENWGFWVQTPWKLQSCSWQQMHNLTPSPLWRFCSITRLKAHLFLSESPPSPLLQDSGSIKVTTTVVTVSREECRHSPKCLGLIMGWIISVFLLNCYQVIFLHRFQSIHLLYLFRFVPWWKLSKKNSFDIILRRFRQYPSAVFFCIGHISWSSYWRCTWLGFRFGAVPQLCHHWWCCRILPSKTYRQNFQHHSFQFSPSKNSAVWKVWEIRFRQGFSRFFFSA